MKSSSKINSDFEVNNGKTYYIKAYNEKCREWQYDDLYPRIMNVKSWAVISAFEEAWELSEQRRVIWIVWNIINRNQCDFHCRVPLITKNDHIPHIAWNSLNYILILE